MVAKAEAMAQGSNPRFVVTSLPASGFKEEKPTDRWAPQRLYEEVYCERGNMENVLKQQVLDLQADRMSTQTWPAINCGSGWRHWLTCCWSGCEP